MSELIYTNDGDEDVRWRLLAGVSILALSLNTAGAECARAEDADKPAVWIELGGQLSRIEGGQEIFAPEILKGRPSIFSPSQKFEQPPRYGFDEAAAISIEPGHAGWVFSASVHYGRAKSNNHVLQQTSPEPFEGIVQKYPVAHKFAETTARNNEQHAVVDFAVGKDVGLGLFGKGDSTSVISAGVRFAQFASKTNISLKSNPDWKFNTKYSTALHITITNGQPFRSNLATMTAERSFHGIGPSLSWRASEPIASDSRDGAIMLDWGLNAAILFGRQKAQTHHQTTQRSLPGNGPILGQPIVLHTVARLPATPDQTRSRSVTVPNIGGFAGLSYRYDTAKLSFGYRADFFFGAMDGGIDARKTYDRNFYGPYATVSIGLGG